VSTFWVHRESGTVAVDDAVLNGIDTSSLPSNVQLVWWYGASNTGEVRYTDSDRLPIRERLPDLEPYVHIFDKWMLAAQTPLPTTSGKTMPAITLAQAKAVKNQLVQGLYTQKSGKGYTDNTASVNAALDSVAAQINQVHSDFASVNASGIAYLNTTLNSQAEGNAANINAINNHAGELGALSGFSIPSGGGSLPFLSPAGAGGITTPQNPYTPSFNPVSNPGVSPGGPYDSAAGMRDYHTNQVNAQSTVAGVAGYDITAGW